MKRCCFGRKRQDYRGKRNTLRNNIKRKRVTLSDKTKEEKRRWEERIRDEKTEKGKDCEERKKLGLG